MPKPFKWSISLLAGLITLAALFAGQTMWLKYAVANPMDKSLHAVDGVDHVRLSEHSTQFVIDVTLKDVKDLSKTYDGLLGKIQDTAGTKKYQLIFHDSRTSEMEDFYNSIQYAIQEAIATGHFTAMVEQITAKADDEQIRAKVWINGKNIYIQLEKNGAQMYEVISRQKAEVK